MAQERPRALAALAAHKRALTAALGALPTSASEAPCGGPEPELPRRAIRPRETSPGLLVLGRDRAIEITRGSPTLFPRGPELYTHVESGPYYRLFRPMSGDGFADAYAVLENARFVAVVTTESLEKGAVENRTIVKPASFTGWATILDLRQPRIVAQLRIRAATDKLVFVHHEGDLYLTDNLASQVFRQIDAALATACPTSTATTRANPAPRGP